MVARTTTEQLVRIRELGFEGEGELSELIEWLGDDFEHLCNGKAIEEYNEYPTTAGKEWEAVSFSNIIAYGQTHIEAVYNLAITLKGLDFATFKTSVTREDE